MGKAPSFECIVGHLAKGNFAVWFYCARPSPTVTETQALHNWARWLKEVPQAMCRGNPSVPTWEPHT